MKLSVHAKGNASFSASKQLMRTSSVYTFPTHTCVGICGIDKTWKMAATSVTRALKMHIDHQTVQTHCLTSVRTSDVIQRAYHYVTVALAEQLVISMPLRSAMAAPRPGNNVQSNRPCQVTCNHRTSPYSTSELGLLDCTATCDIATAPARARRLEKARMPGPVRG